MSSSVIFPKTNDEQFNQFPTFGNGQGFGTSRLDSLLGKNKVIEIQKEEP